MPAYSAKSGPVGQADLSFTASSLHGRKPSALRRGVCRVAANGTLTWTVCVEHRSVPTRGKFSLRQSSISDQSMNGNIRKIPAIHNAGTGTGNKRQTWQTEKVASQVQEPAGNKGGAPSRPQCCAVMRITTTSDRYFGCHARDGSAPVQLTVFRQHRIARICLSYHRLRPKILSSLPAMNHRTDNTARLGRQATISEGQRFVSERCFFLLDFTYPQCQNLEVRSLSHASSISRTAALINGWRAYPRRR